LAATPQVRYAEPMADNELPSWAQDIRSTYLRGESTVFLVHGNVYDLVLSDDEPLPLLDFLVKVLLQKKDLIVHYNPTVGVKFRKKDRDVQNIDALYGEKDAEKVLPALEQLLRTEDGVAILIDYAEIIAPAGDTGFQSEADRRAMVTLHRWSLDRNFENADNVIVLVTELLSEVNQKVVANPRIATIHVPLPDEGERTRLIRLLAPEATQKETARLAGLSAGLKKVQIRNLLRPPGEDAPEELEKRSQFILTQLLPPGTPDAKARAKELARRTPGMTEPALRELIQLKPQPPGTIDDGLYDEVVEVLAKFMSVRRREILEKECFGLIEFVEPHHDFSQVGGMEGVKKELMQIARNIKEGSASRVPMGLLFTGPMGTGKTFVAEAFAKSSGLTAIKLKNFRSKWVGATEGNLEKILTVVKAIGNILVIIDEGDRAFGAADGAEGDGGTSSRVIARIKEFMSDTTNRGRVLFVLMTNRPDKLDIDIKRAGRLDKKIPFFYAQEPEEVEPVLLAQMKRHKVQHAIQFPNDRKGVSERLVGYSNADIEAVVLAANDLAAATGEKVTPEIMERAISDYLPARDSTMLEYMELLAVFESSSRSMLPKRYANIALDKLQERLRELKLRIR
jgi:AAA+ superfamily predicted ATPase